MLLLFESGLKDDIAPQLMSNIHTELKTLLASVEQLLIDDLTNKETYDTKMMVINYQIQSIQLLLDHTSTVVNAGVYPNHLKFIRSVIKTINDFVIRGEILSLTEHDYLRKLTDDFDGHVDEFHKLLKQGN